MKTISKNIFFHNSIKKILNVYDNIFLTDLSIRWHNHRIGFHSTNYYFNTNQYAFIHIPKTGGSTVSHILERLSVYRFKNLHKHCPVSQKCPPAKYPYFTFIRNPIDRVWSYYKMAERDKNNPYHKYASKGLENLLEHCWETRNMTCKYISGHSYRNIDSKTYVTAKRNLLNFFFIGLFDNFEQDLLQLLDKLNLGQQKVIIPHLNFSKKYSYSEHEKNLITKYNHYDIALYNWHIKKREN